MARTPSVWASTWTVSLEVSNSLRIFLIICVLEHLAAFELIDKAQGNDGVWSWEKVSLLIFFRESADSTRWSLYYPQSTVCYLRVLILTDNANKSLDSEDEDEIEVEDGD